MVDWVDTHCHLDSEHTHDEVVDVIARARDRGVVGMVTVGVGRTTGPAHQAVALARQYPECLAATVGLHPHDASTWTTEVHTELTGLGSAEEVVAIGEIGLDYHYDHSERQTQREVFARLISVAKALKKPIVVHTRSAADDTLAILRSEGASEVGGIIHCFSEDWAFAKVALDLGFDLSFSGIVTFKNASAIRDVAARAPEDRILVETDSPYLAPVPFRGKKCEPSFLPYTGQCVAELRGVRPVDLARVTRRNASRRFAREFGVAFRGGP